MAASSSLENGTFGLSELNDGNPATAWSSNSDLTANHTESVTFDPLSMEGQAGSTSSHAMIATHR